MATKPEYRENGFRSALTFSAPASVADAEVKLRELQDAIGEIQAQLASRNRRDPMTGKRMDCHQYWEWRRKAVSAISLKSSELRFVRDWLKARRRDLLCNNCRAKLLAEGMTCRPWE
jgi:hypothetical protein